MGKGDTKEHLELVDKFCKLNDEKHLTTKYPLDSSSIIFDVGAYLCKWTMHMSKSYGCKIHCFEPVNANFVTLQENVKDNKDIICHKFALGAKNRSRQIYLQKDSSSFFAASNKQESVQERDIVEVIKEIGEPNIDLLKINIEGAEFELLEHLILNDMIKIFSYIQIQYHREASNFNERRRIIQKKFSKTHDKRYDYPFVWESWGRK